MVTIKYLLETANGIANGHVLARNASEDLCDRQRLREEPLDSASASLNLPVLVRQFLDSENCYIVLQVAVAL